MASDFIEVIEAGEAILRADNFKIYRETDVVGVEWAGALKNILAMRGRRIDDVMVPRADIISVQVEACPHLHRNLAQIKELGKQAGAVLNPSTPIDTLEYCLELCDLVLIMSVNPGFGGQSFIDNQVQKIRDLRRLCDEKGLDPWIEVDGGVKPANAWKVIEAGANAIVSGSGVFGAADYAEAIQGIRTSRRPQPALV